MDHAKFMLRFLRTIVLVGALGAGTATATEHWTPEPDASSSKEQQKFYKQFRPILPQLDTLEYPTDSVKVYIYPGVDDQRCADNTDPLYFTWYSTTYLVPILSGYKTNSCGRECPDEKRYSGSFATCGISGVDNATYSYSGFDRGHLVNSQSMARMYKASCETFTMCNIAPMTPQLNRYDWVKLENLVEVESEKKILFVLQGSLLGKSYEDAECVCGAEESGRVACNKVKESKCNKQNLEIQIPTAFYKTVYNIEQDRSWSFIYNHNLDKHAQEDSRNMQRFEQSPSEAFIGKNIGHLESYAKFDWSAIRNTAQEYCDWCHGTRHSEITTTSGIGTSNNTHFKYLSFYGLNPDAQFDIINIGGEGSLETKLEMFKKYKIPSFYGGVDGVFNRTARPTTLIDGWEHTIEHMYSNDIEPYLGEQLLGIFLGDEICCHDAPCWENVLQPVASKFRALLGDTQGIIYTNECANEDIASIPVALDAISVDTYAGYQPKSKGEDEVTRAKKIYEVIFSKLHPHQSVFVVPGIFACSNLSYMPLDTIDENTVEKLNAYFVWAMEEPRIIGMNPWHFNNRSHPQHHPPCDMELGAISMPKTLAKLKEIKAKIGPIVPANNGA